MSHIANLIYSSKFWRRRFFKLAILLSSPLGKGYRPLSLQTLIPFTQGYYVPSLVEIGQVLLLLEKILKFRQHIFAILYFLRPFIWTSFIKGSFVPSLAEIGKVVERSGEDFKISPIYRYLFLFGYYLL